MLVRSRVEDNVRMELLKHLFVPVQISDRAYANLNINTVTVFCFEFVLKLKGTVFIYIKNNDRFRLVPCTLLTKLRTDGAAATRDKYSLADEIFANLFVKLDFIS